MKLKNQRVGRPAAAMGPGILGLAVFSLAVGAGCGSRSNGATAKSDGVGGSGSVSPSAASLMASAELGREIAALLQGLEAISEVNSGSTRPELRSLGLASRADGHPIDPDNGDLDLTAGWGHLGKDGIVMPGKGRLLERPYDQTELDSLRVAAERYRLPKAHVLHLVGERTYDVYLNGVAFWKNVPVQVWDYTVGGYQIIKKWLSYREMMILRRAITSEEVRELTGIVRRVAALLLLGPRLDANYENVASNAFKWQTATKSLVSSGSR